MNRLCVGLWPMLLALILPPTVPVAAGGPRSGGIFPRALPNRGLVALATNSGAGYAVAVGNCGARDCAMTLDTRTGAMLRSVALPAGAFYGGGDGCPGPPTRLVLDASRQQAIITTYDPLACGDVVGYVSIVDTRRGRVRRVITPWSLWRPLARSGPHVPPPSVPGGVAVAEHLGRLFILNGPQNGPTLNGGSITLVDLTTAAVVRDVPLPPREVGPYIVAVDEGAGRLYFVTYPVDVFRAINGPAHLHVLDARNGRDLGITTLSAVYSWPVLASPTGPLILLGTGPKLSSPGYVRGLDSAGRTQGATTSVGAWPETVLGDPLTGHAFALSTGYSDGLEKDGVIKVPGSVTMLDLPSLAMRRTITVDALLMGGVLDAQRNHLFVVTAHTPGPTGKTGGPDRVVMLDTLSGAVLRTLPLPSNPVALALDHRHARLFVVSRGPLGSEHVDGWPPLGYGSVSVIDTRTGALQQTIRVGVDPFLLALDEQASRLFVATRGGTLPQPPVPGSPQRIIPGTLTLLNTAAP